MDDVKVHRVSYSCFEITRKGVPVFIYSDVPVPGMPHYFTTVQGLYAACKGVHGVLTKDDDGE